MTEVIRVAREANIDSRIQSLPEVILGSIFILVQIYLSLTFYLILNIIEIQHNGRLKRKPIVWR